MRWKTDVSSGRILLETFYCYLLVDADKTTKKYIVAGLDDFVTRYSVESFDMPMVLSISVFLLLTGNCKESIGPTKNR